MKLFQVIASVALVATCAAVLAPAEAGNWRHRRAYPSLDMSQGGIRYYNPSGVRYYNACPYGDCICLRQRAIASGSQVWWDRYQACAG
jgi:hypothetical protein